MAAQLLPTAYTEKTYAASGADYSSLAAWWAARCNGVNMVAASSGEVLTCSAGVYNDYLATSACTTSEAYFPCVRAASGAQGTPTSGVRFEVSGTAANVIIFTNNNANYMTITGIAMKPVTTAVAADTYAIGVLSQSATGMKVIKTVVYNASNTGNATKSHAMGLYLGYYVGKTYYAISNAVYNTTGGSGDPYTAGMLFAAFDGAVTVYAYSNTVNTCNIYGVLAQTFGAAGNITVNLKNTVAQSCTSGNIASAGSGTETINQTTNQTSGVTFAADGYHLAAATNNGTDLSADAAWAVTTDIDGDTYKTTPSIGCDQFNTAPSAPSNPTPADTATGIAAGDVTLECDVTDDDGDAMDVTFYDASDDSLIGTDAAVASGGTATVTWAGRAAGTLYTWYAKANDGIAITTGPDWTFTTAAAGGIFNFNLSLGLML